MKKIIILFLIFSLLLFPNTVQSQVSDLEIEIGINKEQLFSEKLGIMEVTYGDSLWIKIKNAAIIELYDPNNNFKVSKYYDPMLHNNKPIKLYTFSYNDLSGLWKIKIYDSKGNFIKEIYIKLFDNDFQFSNFKYDFNFSSLILNINIEGDYKLSNHFNRPSLYVAFLFPVSFINYTESLILAIRSEEAQQRPIPIGMFVSNQSSFQNNNEEVVFVIRPEIYNETIGKIEHSIDTLILNVYNFITFYKKVNETDVYTHISNPIFSLLYSKFKVNSQSLNFTLSQENLRTGFLRLEMSLDNRSPFISYRYATTLFIHKTPQEITPYFILALKSIDLNLTNGRLKTNLPVSLIVLNKILKYNIGEILRKAKIGIIVSQDNIFNAYIYSLDFAFFKTNFYNVPTNSFLKDFSILANNTLVYVNNENVFGFGELDNYYFVINGIKIPNNIVNSTKILPYKSNQINVRFYNFTLEIIYSNVILENVNLILIYNNTYVLLNATLEKGRISLLLPYGLYNVTVIKEGFYKEMFQIFLNESKYIPLQLTQIKDKDQQQEEDMTAIYYVLIAILIIEGLANLIVYIKLIRLKT